jgi:hypothetical protein
VTLVHGDETAMARDAVLKWMLQNKVKVTQRNYIEIAYLGDKHSLEELEAEERVDLPEGFEDWPVDETRVN